MISAIVPARDEEENIACVVDSLTAQPEIRQIIVVNDQSRDRTGAILEALATRISILEVKETRALPRGWVGKNYAAWVGAAVARNDWLLFTDADTAHLPGSARKALAAARDHSAALVSYSPAQETRSAWERTVVPFVYCRLAEKFSYARVNNPVLPDAAANGQYLLIRRDAYMAVGGHQAVRAQILEDVALARRVKAAGYGLYFASGPDIARARMYRSFSAMWQGWTKNLYPLAGGTAAEAFHELAVVFPWLVVALVAAALLAPPRLSAVFLILGLTFLAGHHATYAAELHKNHYPLKFILYFVPAVFFYAAALAASGWKNTRGTILWKGRRYTAAEL